MPQVPPSLEQIGRVKLTLVNSVEGSKPGNSLVEYTLNGPPYNSARTGGCGLPATLENMSNIL